MSKADAIMQEVVGAKPPKEGKQLQIHMEEKKISSLLFGIECSAPLKEDLWGHAHGPDAKSKAISAFGKRKWRDFRKGGQDVPADIGGMRVTVGQTQFQQIQDVCKQLKLCKPSEGAMDIQEREREFFRELLSADD